MMNKKKEDKEEETGNNNQFLALFRKKKIRKSRFAYFWFLFEFFGHLKKKFYVDF